MSQDEIIKALKNLGNRATRDDLLNEYFRIHYTDPAQREEFTTNKSYKIGNCLSPYLTKLRQHGIIASKLISVPGKKYSIEYYLLGPEHAK